jgi:SAM-dependent methyltransferase
MANHLPFREHVQEYESWFDRHAAVFESELRALREIWPEDNDLMSLEIGAATGRFSKALKIREALDPESNLLQKATERGVSTMPGMAEDLPYAANQFEVVFIGTSIHYITDLPKAFAEAYRILRNSGKLIIAFIDRESQIGKFYEAAKKDSLFSAPARFFTVKEIEKQLIDSGFVNLTITQTLFGSLDGIREVQPCKSGHGEGAYIIIKAEKPGYDLPLPGISKIPSTKK